MQPLKPSIYHTLYFKLTAGLALMLLVLGMSYTIFASYLAQQINQSSQQLINADLAQNLVKDMKIVHHGQVDQQAMKETFTEYMNINPSIEIYYLDLAGNIIDHSAEAGKVKRDAIDIKPVQLNLQSNNQLQILGDDPRSLTLRKAFSVTVLPSRDNPQGYLYIVLQGEKLTNALDQTTQDNILILAGLVLTGSFLIALLLGLFVFYRINRRIKTLQNKVAEFIEKDFSASKSIDFQSFTALSGDEINELEKHIAQMANHIQQQWSALKQHDNLRREMVANVSHDLRTPLASIQGYLETLTIKFDDLNDAKKKQYLETCVKQAKGLQRLIDSLFELARLEAREHQPKMESFALLDLVYDVVAKFDLKARQKNIRLTVESETNNPMVFADLGLIERVLDNLVSNAIYYSHHDSQINIDVTIPEDASLTVKVSDFGCGISEDQQSLVFERFHQADKPQRSDGHAGLGLCIVKKIIDLHHQSIWMESQPNQGATFNFTLASI